VAQVEIRDLRSRKELQSQETVSPEKASNFWMAAKSAGHTDATARRLLSEFGVVSAKDLPEMAYKSAVDRAASEALVAKYEDQL
jgi:hypothetical protein